MVRRIVHSSTNGKGEKVQVVTTYSIIYDIVKNVGGDLVEIHSLAPIGSNPHEYDPLPVDVQKTTDADAVFYNGLNLEAGNSWFNKLMETAGKDGKDAPVFLMSEGVEAKYLTTEGNEGRRRSPCLVRYSKWNHIRRKCSRWVNESGSGKCRCL